MYISNSQWIYFTSDHENDKCTHVVFLLFLTTHSTFTPHLILIYLTYLILTLTAEDAVEPIQTQPHTFDYHNKQFVVQCFTHKCLWELGSNTNPARERRSTPLLSHSCLKKGQIIDYSQCKEHLRDFWSHDHQKLKLVNGFWRWPKWC